MEVDDWHEMELESIGTVITGRTPSTARSEYFGGDIPFITPTDMDGRRFISTTNRYLSEEGKDAVANAVIPAGAIVVSCIGSDMGKSAIAGRTSVTNQQINSLIVSAPHSTLFVYYNLSSRRDEIRGMAAGSAQPILNKSSFSRIRLRLPPPREQQAIAVVLSALDDKIEQNRRIARALEELARAMFKAWFVDFEPVKAKAAGATGFPGMPPAAFAALPDRLTYSPLGPVPEGWDTPAISEILKQSSERVGTASVPAYSSTNDGLRPRDEQFKKDLAKSFAKNLLIRSGDLVFGNSREILNFGVMYESVGSVSQVYKVFRPHSEVVTPRYIEMMIRECSGFYRQIIRSTTRDNQGIMADFFLQLPLLVPPQEFRDAYAAVEKPVREMIDHLQAESAKFAALRDYLLPRLLSGQVRVRSSQAEAKT